MFDPKPYLKELARGKNGARDMTREQARTLFSAVFAGELEDVALGALLVALRVKGSMRPRPTRLRAGPRLPRARRASPYGT